MKKRRNTQVSLSPVVRFAIAAVTVCLSALAPFPLQAAVIPPLRTDVRIAIGRDIAPGPSVRVSINTRNVAVVRMAVFELDRKTYLLSRAATAQDGEDPDVGKSKRPTPLDPRHPARVWSISAQDPKTAVDRQQSEVYRSRQINLESLHPGVYLIVAAGGGREAWAVANVTNLAVVVKRAPTNMLCWVTDHVTGNPIAGAHVELWNHTPFRLAAHGVTRSDGTLELAAPPNPAQTLIIERRANRSLDVAGLDLAIENPNGRLVSHLQTDRPVYSPGNRVQFRSILRRTSGRAYQPDGNAAYEFEVRDSHENVIQRTHETTNAMGTIAESVDIPSRAALGAYSIVLTARRDKQTAYASFTVAEYRKPEFATRLSPSKPSYLAGETAVFVVDAAYYFGAPLPAAVVKYQVRRTANPFNGGSFASEDEQAQWFSGGDGNLYERDTYSSVPFVAEGTVQTDSHGRVEISFPTKNDEPDMVYRVSCTVTDGQRRQVDAENSVPVYSAALRLGVRTPVLCAPVESTVPVDLRLADLDGKAASGRVTLVTRHEVAKKKPDETVWVQLSSTEVKIGANGKARATVPALATGDLQILATVTDSTGRIARAATSVYVAEASDASVHETEVVEPTVNVRLNRQTYRPGDTVSAYVSTNTPSRPLLITIEGGKLFRYVVIPKGHRSCTWATTVDVEWSPNAYLTASQWAPHARLVSGSAIVAVPDLARRLSVSIEPDRNAYRPGDRATYVVRVKDGLTGKPVGGAEASVAVVDESIFAVRPDTTADPYETYWGLRDNLTDTRMSAPEEVSGGAYQRNNPNGVASVRDRFLDTAYWNPRAVTGKDGSATVIVDMPGNLTSWRATAIAVTAGTKVGRATKNVNVSRTVMLRLSTPRQFVQGDTLRLIGTVNNRTEKDRSFDVTLASSELAIAVGEAATKTISVPAKSEGRVEWTATASKIPDNPSMSAQIEGTLIGRDLTPGEAMADFSDRVRVAVPILPRGVAERSVVGAPIITGDSAVVFNVALADDRIEPASSLSCVIENGVGPYALDSASDVFRSPAWGTGGLADQLAVAAAPGAPAADAGILRDAIAGLERDQQASGAWGYWQSAPADARITARILSALTALRVRASILPVNLPFPDKMYVRAIEGAKGLYNNIALWEERSLLASCISDADPKSRDLLVEVLRRGGDGLSPYATLRLAQSLYRVGERSKADQVLSKVIQIAVVGVDTARIPAGDHPGWSASEFETSSQALSTLVTLGREPSLQTKLAHYLVNPAGGYGDDQTAGSASSARALLAYVASRNARTIALRNDDVSVNINGQPIAFSRRAIGTENIAPLIAEAPRGLLRNGINDIVVHRLSNKSGEWFLRVETTVYRPQNIETGSEIRVLRRFETQTAFGTWKELKADAPVSRAGVPIRITVVVWPNDDADVVKVTEPMPTGFEFVDSELPSGALEEVRDGVILHFLRATGSAPITFRYYLRAESEGAVVALPATGELIGRPSIHGNSALQSLQIQEKRPE